MFDFVIDRKNKLGISILLAAMILYGNSSCQKVEKAEQVKEFKGRKSGGGKTEEGEGNVANGSIGAESVGVSEATISDDGVTANQDPADVVCGLTIGSSWMINKDKKKSFEQNFCKLVCEYLVCLVSGADNMDPVVNFDSFLQFFVNQDVQLQMHKMAREGGMGNSANGPDGTEIYVVDDIGHGKFGKTSGNAVFVRFKDYSVDKRRMALWHLFQAMSGYRTHNKTEKCATADASVGSPALSSFGEYFSSITDLVYRLGNSDPLEKLIATEFLSNVTKCVQYNLFKSSFNDLYFLDGNIVSCKDQSSGSEHIRPEEGLFFGTLVWVPYLIAQNKEYSNALGGDMDLSSLMEPLIFFIKDKNDHTYVLGTVRDKQCINTKSNRSYKVYVKYAVSGNDKGALRQLKRSDLSFFYDLRPSEISGNTQKKVAFVNCVMRGIYGSAWDYSLDRGPWSGVFEKNDIDVQFCSYQDTVDSFYKGFLLESLEQLKKSL